MHCSRISADAATPASPELARLLSLETVPPVTTVRWLPRHKAQVVQAVEAELLSVAEVCSLYNLTVEEFSGWQRKFQRFGLKGLQATKRCANPFEWPRGSGQELFGWARSNV